MKFDDGIAATLLVQLTGKRVAAQRRWPKGTLSGRKMQEANDDIPPSSEIAQMRIDNLLS